MDSLEMTRMTCDNCGMNWLIRPEEKELYEKHGCPQCHGPVCELHTRTELKGDAFIIKIRE